MPSPSRGGRGFFRLDLRGDRTTVSAEDPLETLVSVVLIEAILPFVIPLYGLPDASVTDTPER